jgi:hypothetical protein
MKKFILLSFAFLGLGFYELSGGAGFDPESARQAHVEARQDREADRLAALPQTGEIVARSDAPSSTVPRETPDDSQVTRAALNLVSFEKAVSPDPEPMQAETADIANDDAIAEIAELAAAEDLSLAALETVNPNASSIAFSGNSISASSSAAAASDVRTVKGSLVNMRSGPGTDYDVVDQLVQSTQVEILTDSGNGWVELRPLDGGPTGWIAEFLLTGG